jgi:hypothetical protein
MATPTPPRKFKVEPVETSAKKTPRKFAPEPIETSTSSSRKSKEASVEPKSRRKFLPQPIETSHASNKKDANASPSGKPMPRQFVPQLIESSSGPGHQDGDAEHKQESEPMSNEGADLNSEPQVQELPRRRKFTPVLLDTAKRTRRSGDLRPAHRPSDRTDAIPEAQDGIRRLRKVQFPAQPENTPVGTGFSSPGLSSAERRRLGIPVPRRQTSTSSHRQHSFRAPSLDPIDSSESGEESQHSSVSSSPSSSSDMSYQLYKHATRLRESIDASSRSYLLELAAKAAERQLCENGLAAFPNDDRHVRVDHYIGHDSDETTTRSTRSELDHRRFDSVNWEIKDMRRHHENLEAEREKEKTVREARRKWNKQYEENCGPWRNPFKNQVSTKPHQKDNVEMDRMREQARPPMLGSEIDFPRCSSPEPARFDVTQGTYTERTAMCYLTEQSEPGPCGEGLWAVRAKQSIGLASSQSQAPSRSPSSSSGLWGGMCRGEAGGMSPGRGPSGLLTPCVLDEEMANPFEHVDLRRHLHQLPPSPPPSNSGVVSLDEKLELEQAVEAEFTDEFVTQVYNYLSLGYPSIARRYDEELGKITAVPVSDLRHDDELESSRGYIRLGEDGNAQEEGIKEDMCARWKALRAYIHEWARQQPGMCEPNHKYGGFGVAVRRGSWAW